MTPDQQRFLSQVETTSGCWTWRGFLNDGGYGRFTIMGEPVYAHRFSHEHFVGAIPDGFEVDHLCKNPGCVRPSHLEAVAPRVNNLRSSSRAAENARRTHCVNGHELVGENVAITVSGGVRRRRCRVCSRLRTAEWKARQRG